MNLSHNFIVFCHDTMSLIYFMIKHQLKNTPHVYGETFSHLRMCGRNTVNYSTTATFIGVLSLTGTFWRSVEIEIQTVTMKGIVHINSIWSNVLIALVIVKTQLMHILEVCHQ